MKIIIVGLGKVGYAIAQQMVGEEHDLILVDESAAVIEHADATLDAMCVEGNGACASVLLRAGVRDADLVIAAIIVLLLWVYLSPTMMTMGAEFNSVLMEMKTARS